MAAVTSTAEPHTRTGGLLREALTPRSLSVHASGRTVTLEHPRLLQEFQRTLQVVEVAEV
jgi:hypothetical protein